MPVELRLTHVLGPLALAALASCTAGPESRAGQDPAKPPGAAGATRAGGALATGGGDSALDAGASATVAATPEARRPARPFSRLGRYQATADPDTGALTITPVDDEGHPLGDRPFGLAPHASMEITTHGATASTSPTVGTPYQGLGDAGRICKMRTASNCQAADGGALDQTCQGTICASVYLQDIVGVAWSEVWIEIDGMPPGYVNSGDDRSLLTPTDWRVAAGMHDSATSLGAWRYGSLGKDLLVGVDAGPDSTEADWEIDWGPGISVPLFSPTAISAWGAESPNGYTVTTKNTCKAIPVPSTGTTVIFSSTAVGGETEHTKVVTGGLPFPFTLYGETDTTFWASYDGAYGLGAAPLKPGVSYGPLPTSATTGGLILPQWGKTEGRTVTPLGDVVGFSMPAATLPSYVISATGVRWLDLGGEVLGYQLVLVSDGSIRFIYPGGLRSIGTSGTAPQNVLLGAPISGAPNLGVTIGLQGAANGSTAPFAQYGSGGKVTAAGLPQPCYPTSGGPCAPTLLPGAPNGGVLDPTACFEIDFTPN